MNISRNRDLNPEENMLCNSLANAIIRDIEKIKMWQTKQKELYISFYPSPPQNDRLLKITSIIVTKQTGASVFWKVQKKISKCVPGQIYAYVMI